MSEIRDAEFKVNFLENPNTILIDGLYIDDPKFYNFLYEQYEKSENSMTSMNQLVKNLLIFGQMTFDSFNVTNQTKHIDEKFSYLTSSFEDLIKNNLLKLFTDSINNQIGSGSDFSKLLETKFGKDGDYQQIIDEVTNQYKKQIETLTDYDNVNSPFYKLIKQVDDHQKVMLDKFNDLAIFKKLNSVGTSKGVAFEKELFSILKEISDGSLYTVESTGNIDGKKGKKGDFVFRSDMSNLVVESKTTEKITRKYVSDYLDECMINRESQFGLLIHLDENIEGQKTNLSSFHPIGENKLFLSLNVNDDYTHNVKILRLAIKYSFTILLFLTKPLPTSDNLQLFNRIKESITERLVKIEDIQKNSTLINNKSAIIFDLCNDMIKSINTDLDDFKKSLD